MIIHYIYIVTDIVTNHIFIKKKQYIIHYRLSIIFKDVITKHFFHKIEFVGLRSKMYSTKANDVIMNNIFHNKEGDETQTNNYPFKD